MSKVVTHIEPGRLYSLSGIEVASGETIGLDGHPREFHFVSTTEGKCTFFGLYAEELVVKEGKLFEEHEGRLTADLTDGAVNKTVHYAMFSPQRYFECLQVVNNAKSRQIK